MLDATARLEQEEGVMTTRVIHPGAALVLLLLLATTLLAPACVLKIGKSGSDGSGGSDDTTATGGLGGEPGTSTGGDGETWVSEKDIDDANALFAAHPEEVALGSLKASYTALALSSLVFDGTTDPNDVATVEVLVEQYTATAIEEAENWIAALDTSTLQEAFDLVYSYPLQCIYEPYECSPKLLNCPWLGEDHLCYLSERGLGKCSFCPFPFPAPVRSWCIHSCFRIGDGSFVGNAVYITLVGGVRLGPICVPK
jgi:hypothetical protein